MGFPCEEEWFKLEGSASNKIVFLFFFFLKEASHRQKQQFQAFKGIFLTNSFYIQSILPQTSFFKFYDIFLKCLLIPKKGILSFRLNTPKKWVFDFEKKYVLCPYMYDMVESIFLVYLKVRYDFYFFKTCHILVQSHCWPLYTFEEKVTKHYKFHQIDISKIYER